jgi:hypothetical protein
MRMAASLIAAALTVVLSSPVEAQERPAGYVKVVTGVARIVRGGSEMLAHPGDAIYEHDGLRTEADGRLGITLKDDTRISLGSNSEIDLSEFKFSPPQGQLGLVMKLLRGVAAFVSGRIEALRPDAVRLETPHTIVGVRGTHLLLRTDGP